MIPRVRATLLTGIGVLEQLDLKYAVVGGLAVSLWSTPRATRDVDLFAELPLHARAELEAALTAAGFDVPAMSEELERFGVFRSKLLNHQVFLDIFDATGPLGDTILARRTRVVSEGREIWFASAEDLAVLKAFSDRRRDEDDLVALLAVPDQGLDLSYVEHWAKVLDQSIGGNDVSERLSRASRAAELQRNRLRRE